MTARLEEPTPAVAELIRATARRALADVDALAAEMDAAVLGAVPALAADAAIASDTSASNRANIVRWLQSNQRDPGRPVPHDITPEAFDIARAVVRRGIDQEALLTGYRQGQNAAWRGWMQAASAMAADTQTLGRMLDLTARSMFSFVDDILAGVHARMEQERDQLVGGRHAARLETVTLVLEGAPISEQRASVRLGYELAARHMAFVLWTSDESAAAEGALEPTADLLARVAGAHRPFTMPAGTSVLWAWIALSDAPDLGALRAAVEAGPSGVAVAAGSCTHGIAGFRRSHEEALAAQRLAMRGGAEGRLVAHEEVEVVVLAAADEERAARFVAATLGDLADAREEIRETLRVFLRERGSATRTARCLYTHRNTILKRIARAEALLPRPLDGHELSVALALELRRWMR